MDFKFDSVYYEEDILNYTLGKYLKDKYSSLEWFKIASHNYIPEFTSLDNKQFVNLKRKLVIGTRKTHKYTPNQKLSEYLVPFTSSGCYAMCLYCYLVCNYNKCSYLRIFVNREYMLENLIKKSNKEDFPKTFEIGSNSDLILENQITNNLPYVIENFSEYGKGNITFPTKFSMVDSLLNLNHKGKVIFRMSFNPEEIINKIEIGTSKLFERINAINKMSEAGYECGILLAPIILVENWQEIYSELIDILSNNLHNNIKNKGFIEIIFMTYSFVQNAINTQAFPNAYNLFDKTIMLGRGRGKYCYNNTTRNLGEKFLIEKLSKSELKNMNILYVV